MEIKITLLKWEFQLSVKKKIKKAPPTVLELVDDAKLNFGPGPNWERPGNGWYSIDVDPDLGDVVVDFQQFEALPFRDHSAIAVYGSHVFEHMSIFRSPLVFAEIYRVLKPGGVFRMVLPDAEKSIREYINKNYDFLLFKRRKARAKQRYDRNYTLFECLREDFLSPSGQASLLGENALAHQNAWDYETIHADLERAGFGSKKIKRMEFQQSQSDHFSFEGAYPSEANEDYRSLYVEAVK